MFRIGLQFMSYAVDGECTHSPSLMQSIQVEQERLLKELLPALRRNFSLVICRREMRLYRAPDKVK